MTDPLQTEQALRRAALGVLARAAPDSLAAQWQGYVARQGGEPAFVCLRGPEIGLTMVRGRMGGTGRPFNVGEATVTRCTLRTGCGRVGTAYVLGRQKRQAEIQDAITRRMETAHERLEKLEAIHDVTNNLVKKVHQKVKKDL